jgi:hypothetical protein
MSGELSIVLNLVRSLASFRKRPKVANSSTSKKLEKQKWQKGQKQQKGFLPFLPFLLPSFSFTKLANTVLLFALLRATQASR